MLRKLMFFIIAKTSCLVLLLMLFLRSPLAAAAPHPLGLLEDNPYGILTNDYATPHVKWAKPYYRGKVRALVLAPQWGQRETVELAQRLSLDYTPWMAGGFKKAYIDAVVDYAWPPLKDFMPSQSLTMELLDKYLKIDYDVIIIGKLDWGCLPPLQRFEILRKVAGGTGLVYINPPKGNGELGLLLGKSTVPDGVSRIAGNLPLSALPRFRDRRPEDLVQTVFWGKGRVVFLHYGENYDDKKTGGHCLTPEWENTDINRDFWHVPATGYIAPDELPEIELVPYEYYQALVARAVLWSSVREPETTITGINLPESMAWPASAGKVEVAFGHIPAGAVARAVVRSRRDYDSVYDLGQIKVSASAVFSLPDLAAGDYFVDVWALDKDKVLTWGSRAFTVTADFRFGPIKLDKPSYDNGDAVSGEVLLPRKPEKDEHLVVSLWDNYRRKIEEQELSVTDVRAVFKFAGFEPQTILHRVRITLERAGKEVCIKEHTFPVRARLGWDDFNEVVWLNLSDNSHMGYYMSKKLKEQDQADALLGGGGSITARNIAAANLAVVPYAARYGVFNGRNAPNNIVPELSGGKEAYGCMSSPVTLAGLDRWGKRLGEIFGPYGPLAWTSGDETIYSMEPDICRSPTCLKTFREQLKGTYPGLEALNHEWGTSYKSWDEVVPATFKEAKENGRNAAWVEHRLSACRTFADFYGQAGQALAVNDHGARSGFDGPQEGIYPNNGMDWWQLSRKNGILQDYIHNSEHMEIFRSFARKGQLTGMWYGTYGLTHTAGPITVPFSHFFPWYSLFHGLNSSWFWTMGAPGPFSGYAPDLTSLPFYQARTEALRQIKSGIGKLLLSGKRENDRIGIFFSNTSRIADSLYTGDGVWSRKYLESLADFNESLEDSGLQYDYVSYEQVAQGKLLKDGFKVFIMPCSRAVSPAEAAEIGRFVREGGLLIADIMPGILNEHGTPQKESLLAELFPSREPGTVNRVGKGKTVLFDNKLSGYGYTAFSGMKGWRHLNGRWQLLAELLEREAGVSAPVKISPLKAAFMPPTEISRFRCGEVEFISLLRNYYMCDNRPYAASVRLPHKAHVYDVLAGKYLGCVDSLETEISYQAHLYALVPYQVKAVVLSLPDRTVAGKVTQVGIRLSTDSRQAKMDGHVFRLEVLAPDKESIAWYARNILADDKGTAAIGIPWALNDKPGKYTVKVRDVVSGVTAYGTVVLQ